MNKLSLFFLLLPLLSACTIVRTAPSTTPNQSIPTPSVTPTPTRSFDPDQQLLDDLNNIDDQDLDKSLLELESELK